MIYQLDFLTFSFHLFIFRSTSEKCFPKWDPFYPPIFHVSTKDYIDIMGQATSSFTFVQVLVTVTDEDHKVLAKNSSAHLVLKFVSEFQYQDMSVSCSRWASRMNLINFLQQQDIIIRWRCLRLSLALELDNLSCVISSGGISILPWIKERLCTWKEILCWAVCELKWEGLKN